MRDLVNLPMPPSNSTLSSQKFGSNSLSIQDLPNWVGEKQLKDYIYEFSKIKPVSCKIITQNYKGGYGATPQKSGLITFESADDAECVL